MHAAHNLPLVPHLCGELSAKFAGLIGLDELGLGGLRYPEANSRIVARDA